MDEQTARQLQDTIREIEAALLAGDYERIGSESRTSRLSAAAIRAALADYGGTVTPAPSDAYEAVEPIYILDPDPPQWFVAFDLWIDGARSDLTLLLIVKRGGAGELTALVDDLHML